MTTTTTHAAAGSPTPVREFQRAKADYDFSTGAQELRTNTDLARAIHILTNDLHRHLLGEQPSNDEPPSSAEPSAGLLLSGALSHDPSIFAVSIRRV